MSEAPDRSSLETAAAQDKLSHLNAQVAAMRAVLTQLLQDVVRAEGQWERSQARLLVEANEQLVVSALGALDDAEAAKDARDEASRISGLDCLTGLPNRALLLDRLENAISNAKRHGCHVALLFLDLNGFKRINDTFGHATGDQALRLVATGLSSLVREVDTVCRYGGDEFLVLLADIAHAEDAQIVADKVTTVLGAYSRVDGHEVRLEASVGISVYPQDGLDAKTLIDHADAAMYLAKRPAAGARSGHSDATVEPDDLAPAANHFEPERLSRHEREMAEQELRHTTLRDANEQLVLSALGAQSLLAAAEETRQRQRTLLALVAEELRNPFAPIRLAAATLGRPHAHQAMLPGFQAIIEQQVDRISRLVNEILDPRELLRAPLLPGRQSLDATQPIGAAIESCRQTLERRLQSLEVAMVGPLVVAADPGLLAQTVMRLLTHASQYTHNGGSIQLVVARTGDELRLTVTDSGRALTPPAVAPSFDPFVLDPRTDVMHDDGLHLRLAALQEVVEAQAGTVAAIVGANGQGSQFMVSIPTPPLQAKSDRPALDA